MAAKQPPKNLVLRVRRFRDRRSAAPRDERALCDSYREVLRQFRAQAATSGEPGAGWRALAREALRYLGGDEDRHAQSLSAYDHHQYGSFLGVSDEGGASRAISRAARASPKALALGKPAPFQLGVAVDAERLSAVGEVPVGPDEYSDVWLACAGRLLMTTNVGSRVNARLLKGAPLVTILGGLPAGATRVATAAVEAEFRPFVETPDGEPRPQTVLVEFERGSRRPRGERVRILRALRKHVLSTVPSPATQTIALNLRIGWGPRWRDAVLSAIEVAEATGIRELSVDGVVRKEAESAGGLPGLLNFLAPGLIGPILRRAKACGVHVRTRNAVDPETIARGVWSALNSARNMGLHVGKYGAYPLTLDEADAVMGRVQGWFPRWSVAPVFYLDQGTYDRHAVYVGHDRAKGLEAWLKLVAKHRIPVVLVDTVDKAAGWRILRTGPNDSRGLLGPEQLARLNALAARLGIKVLWAGGITLPQAYEFGKLGVFGIYVTTAAARSGPVTGSHRTERGLAAMKVPTYEGVSRTAVLLQAGFLASSKRLAEGLRAQLDDLARQLVSAIAASDPEASVKQRALEHLMTKAWTELPGFPRSD